MVRGRLSADCPPGLRISAGCPPENSGCTTHRGLCDVWALLFPSGPWMGYDYFVTPADHEKPPGNR